MGYTTDFEGRFELDKPLTPAQSQYLQRFASICHWKRDIMEISSVSDPLREAVNLPVGIDGEFFVAIDPDERKYPLYASSMPQTNYCQWVPTKDNQGIEWDGNEKFYCYLDWLRYIIEKFLIPWNLILNGQVTYQGEDPEDCGVIRVENNSISVEVGLDNEEEIIEIPPSIPGRIQKKLNKAATLIDEARELAEQYISLDEESYGTIFDQLNDALGEYAISDGVITGAMDSCGWNTSALSCS